MILEFVSNGKPVFKLTGDKAITTYKQLMNEPLVLKEQRKFIKQGFITVFFVEQTLLFNVSNDIDFYFNPNDLFIVKP